MRHYNTGILCECQIIAYSSDASRAREQKQNIKTKILELAGAGAGAGGSAAKRSDDAPTHDQRQEAAPRTPVATSLKAIPATKGPNLAAVLISHSLFFAVFFGLLFGAVYVSQFSASTKIQESSRKQLIMGDLGKKVRRIQRAC